MNKDRCAFYSDNQRQFHYKGFFNFWSKILKETQPFFFQTCLAVAKTKCLSDPIKRQTLPICFLMRKRVYKPMKDKRFFNRFKLNSGINSTIFVTNMFGTSKSKDKLSFFSYFGIIIYKKFVHFQKMDKIVLLKHFYLFLHFTWKLILKNDLGGRFRIV